MIVSSVNREIAIVSDIKNTIAQIKQGGKANQPLVLQDTGTCAVSFYVDSDRTQLLFSDDSNINPDAFTIQGGRTFYAVADEKINFSEGVSELYAQPLYYVTATFDGDRSYNLTYRNIDNLVFQSIIVTTKANAKFSTNDNTVMIYPRSDKTQNVGYNDDLAFMCFPIDLYVQLTPLDYTNLSEEKRWQAGQNVANLIKDALYLDRYRNGNATFYSKDYMGTNVSAVTIQPSDATLKVKLEVQTVYRASSTGY